MLVHLRPGRFIAAIFGSSLLEAVLTATAAACSNGNGFPF